MAKRSVPIHPDGWKFQASTGESGFVFHIWHAGYLDYRITPRNEPGETVGQTTQLGLAVSRANSLARIAASEAAA